MEQKGAAIKSTLVALERLHGAAGLRAVIEALPPKVREQIEPTLLPVKWYPIEVSAAVHAAIRDRLGKGAWDASHAIGIEASRIDFTGIYRVFLRAVHYDTIWERMERAWGHYNSKGRLQWEERGEGAMQVIISGVSGFNPGVWNAIAGRSQGLLLLSGAKAANVTVKDMTPVSARVEGVWFD